MTGEAPQTVEDDIRRRIEADGPMPFEAYMAACLGAEEAGFYQTRDPFGEGGDFVTAPEISGMFGEMCGLYLAHMYELSGKPADAVVVELGPGRGTLMRDMRHVWSAMMPELAAAPVHLVETSPMLRSIQNGTIGESAPVTWYADTDELVAGIEGPLFGIANEFFDALPQRSWLAGRQLASTHGRPRR